VIGPGIPDAGWQRLAPALILIVICLALCGVIAGECLRWQDDATPLPPAAAGPTAPALPLKFAMPALPTYAEVLSRPLFSSTRRPAEDAPVAVAPTTPMTLIAILISHRGPHALVRHGNPPQLDRVVEGETIEGWTAEAIKVDRVIFRRGADTMELVPTSPEQPRPPAAPARPTPPGTTG
jgi:hypothetical protein